MTNAAFALVLAVVFLSTPTFMRLLQGQTPFYSLPAWLRYCLFHPAPLKTLARLGFGFSLLGSMLTLFLLLKTGPPNIAYGHLAGIGWAELLMTSVPFGVVLGILIISVVSGGLSWGGLAGQLRSLLPGLPEAAITLFALNLILITIPFSFVKIVARLKASASAQQTPHVLQ